MDRTLSFDQFKQLMDTMFSKPIGNKNKEYQQVTRGQRTFAVHNNGAVYTEDSIRSRTDADHFSENTVRDYGKGKKPDSRSYQYINIYNKAQKHSLLPEHVIQETGQSNNPTVRSKVNLNELPTSRSEGKVAGIETTSSHPLSLLHSQTIKFC